MSLISTYDIRLWMGLDEGDRKPNAKLASLALVVEDFVDSYTNRKLEAKRYLTDPSFSYYDGKGRDYLYLQNFPVSYVSSVNIDESRTFGSGTLLSSSAYFFYPQEGKIKLTSGVYAFDVVGGGFTRGRRNVLVDYTAGYAPVVGGTHDMAVSTYPIPNDLKQVMIEMCSKSFKEGMTAVHSVATGVDSQGDFSQMLTKNSFWKITLDKYKNLSSLFFGRDE